MFNNTYKYSKFFPSILMFFLIVTPTFILFYSKNIGIGNNSFENTMIFILCLPILIMIMAPLLWLINLFSIRIDIYDDRLEVKSLFRKLIVKWNEIAELNKKSYFSGTFPIYGPPRDLEIKTKSNKVIKIYYFIDSAIGDDGIKNLESDIRKNMKDVNA